MIYVMGIFDCGCNYDACFGSLEIVECKTKPEGKDIIKKMNKHSANSQCDGRKAMYVLIFEGKLEERTPLIRKPKGIEEKNYFNYQSYCSMWQRQGKENERMKKELKELNKK